MAVVSDNDFDAIVIGGGFYGAIISIYLSQHKKLKKILIVESEHDLMLRSSATNQARVHNGYHYPRSFSTAYRSRVNFPKFVDSWKKSVKSDFTNIYAVAKKNSKITSFQFEKFCNEIGAKLKKANKNITHLFNHNFISGVYEAEEFVFDINEIRDWAKNEIKNLNIQTLFGVSASSVDQFTESKLRLNIKDKSHFYARYIFNCTYSGVNMISQKKEALESKLKHEISEIAIIKPPSQLRNMGITIIDGPFFSQMPFPSLGAYSLTHVRYTPHYSWIDTLAVNPYEELKRYEKITNYDRMIRDASRYIPLMIHSKYIDSIFEIKTVLVANESNDGRPILFEKSREINGFYSILGGKLDNIFDVIEKLNDESIL